MNLPKSILSLTAVLLAAVASINAQNYNFRIVPKPSRVEASRGESLAPETLVQFWDVNPMPVGFGRAIRGTCGRYGKDTSRNLPCLRCG